MPPHLPLIAISRSQSLRIGRGPGSALVPPFNMGDTPTNPQTGALYTLLYADLGNASVRRDVQHHSAEGAIETVAGAASLNVWSDLFLSSGSATQVTAGTAYGLTVAGGVIQSRFYGPTASLPVVGGANVLTIPAPNATFDRYDQVYVTPAGTLGYLAGQPGSVAPVYNVLTVVTSGVPTGGTFTLGFQHNGYTFLTGTIAWNGSAASIATAMLAAAGNVSGATAQQMKLPATSLAGTGGALPTLCTITASGALEGPITNLTLVNNALTGGASPSVTLATTAVGSGGVSSFVPGGINLPLADVFVPAAAANAAGCTITNITLTS